MFFVIIGMMLLFDVVFWTMADRAVRILPRPRLWRIAVGVFVTMMLMFLMGVMFLGRALRDPAGLVASLLVAPTMVWHLFVLPLTVVTLLIFSAIGWARDAVRRRTDPHPNHTVASGQWPAGSARPTATGLQDDPPPHGDARSQDGPDTRGLTRRRLLAGAVVVAPPLLLTWGVHRGLSRIGEFRVRPITVPLPSLPPALDGLTITHVSDLHIGNFVPPWVADRVAAAVNDLRNDLVVFTGDLIDYSINDLTKAIDFCRRIARPSRFAMCIGNHDTFHDEPTFVRHIKSAGLPLLIDEWTTLEARGVKIDVAGVDWDRAEKLTSRRIRVVASQRPPRSLAETGRFPMLLVHHPHGFDPATEAGFALTLAGHTHGGQLMLRPNLGPATALYRYVSGLYRKESSALVVSNGVGNWFPLRLNAPAELIQITLRRTIAA